MTAATSIPGPGTSDAGTPASAGDPLLRVEDIVVSFDGFRAIDGLSLSVAPGELRFLIGPNGAGKTTLVDVVTGLTRAASGRVVFDGDDITGMASHRIVRRGIGRSFQTPTVFERLTVTENLDLAHSFRRPFLRLLGRRRGTSEAVAATLERVGLAAHADRLAGALSHGQKQWLEMGMLLVQNPRLLLLDEPVAGMSPQERTETGELLRSLAGEHTILVIEHDMAFLRAYADTVTVLHEGKLLSEGDVDYVQHDPRVREVYLGRARDRRSGSEAEAEPEAGAEPGAGAGPAGDDIDEGATT